jgi:hypothetical protein
MRTLADVTVVSDRIELEPLSDDELSIIAAGSRAIGGTAPIMASVR